MADATWGDWFKRLQHMSGGLSKRRPLAGQSWSGLQAEQLEERAMLSASGIPAAGNVAAHHAKAGFEFPQVAGSWGVTITQESAGTATFTQKGKTVTADGNIAGIGEFHLKDKFTKSSPDTLSDKIKIKDPEVGKFTVEVTITFPSDPGSPAVFSGVADTPDGQIEFAGLKDLPGSNSLPAAAKMPVEFPDVSGPWNLTVTQEQLGTLTGILNITQQGKGGKNVKGTVNFETGDPLTFSGKFNKQNLFEVAGKVHIPIPETNFSAKASLTITFNIEYDTFSGTAASHRFDDGEISATRVLP